MPCNLDTSVTEVTDYGYNYLHPVVYCVVDAEDERSNPHHVVTPRQSDQRDGSHVMNDHLLEILNKEQ